ncbi:tRNA pseudouridine(13) synthase TruD [Parahaliea aestuarii]|uniref:tRNA pseudouridine synthase D n=1 Tax=Parahaliea aestuarii TaxID=1852021 RepID=A0A5C8ZY33_9GAMM|nr:tRNA pseudouridine(13) synthase TruD [Parahaliea aestuarii]TXS93503.1 tRNA pseudouridine(13) synthase TruD [Parahaliea aestuarii]
MNETWPTAGPAPSARGLIRQSPEDFIVREQLGFEPDGSGEHAFLHLQKRGLNTADLAQRISEISGVALRDIGFSGMKDRHAVTSQWFSVGLAGRAEPDWSQLERSGEVSVLAASRHGRKLRRGVHRANQFTLTLRQVEGEREDLLARLQGVRDGGVPNYFGEQRFGRAGNTLVQARQWAERPRRKLSRTRRGLYLSALRSLLFNRLLARRVAEGSWNTVLPGDVCSLQGTRSRFACNEVDADIAARAAAGDLHPALPLWGRGEPLQGPERLAQQAQILAPESGICRFLEDAGLSLDYRPARALPDDFCWQFCDDGSLQLAFSLGAGSYATAVLAQIIDYSTGDFAFGDGSE